MTEEPKTVLHVDLVTIPKSELERLRTIGQRVLQLADQMDEDAIGINGTESRYLPSAAALLREIVGEG